MLAHKEAVSNSSLLDKESVSHNMLLENSLKIGKLTKFKGDTLKVCEMKFFRCLCGGGTNLSPPYIRL